MLKAAEIEIKKEHQVLMVNKTPSFKKQGKSKGKFKKGGKKAATPPMKPKNGPKPDAECYYCKEKGHWKRNCSKYLADLKSGLVKKKKEVTMRVGNGSKDDVIVVGTLPLHLPSGLVLSLNNCYFVPALSMNIISGSCLMQDVKRMKKLHTDGLLESLDFESLDRCEACLMGKMTKTPFWYDGASYDLLEIIHTDVCGPMSVASHGGYRYVLTFTDDLSRYGYIYFMKHKSETFEKFKEFQSEVENQRNKKIKFLRSDRGGEYLSYEFGMHLKKCGILSQLTPPGTPQRNGVSERRNRTLLDMTAAFTLNRAPSKSLESTPYELWFNKKPKLSFLKVWGCEAYVKKLQPDKLEPKAEKCVFIGYPKETIGVAQYRKYVPPTPATEEANDNDHETSNEETTEPRRSTRERATPDWYDPCLNVMIVDNNDEDPATYEEAMMSPDSNKWQEAMKSEMGSMYDNKVWTLVDLPNSRKAVENKWIFKKKTDADVWVRVYIEWSAMVGKLEAVHGGEVFNRIRVHSGFGGFIEATCRPTLGCSTYIMRAKGRGPATQDHKVSAPPKWPAPPSPQTLAAPLLLLSRTLSEAPPENSNTTATTPSCCRIQEETTTSAARWNGEVDVDFINTERVTSTEVLPVRGAVIKIFYALLQAASERLPQQQEPHLVGFGTLQG
ncbi:hypothetical protein QYE76_019284 [Lolium multiflorum]|uniref:Retrotransposon protein, putative, Ty1-copia subclass n=1 Tax=Lolium multiflorum TaxID=4521 RepID=A0AAD8R4S6_LOLMU|nr:hypothetical protein QYE76_019284 [Lolium multiflorum]